MIRGSWYTTTAGENGAAKNNTNLSACAACGVYDRQIEGGFKRLKLSQLACLKFQREDAEKMTRIHRAGNSPYGSVRAAFSYWPRDKESDKEAASTELDLPPSTAMLTGRRWRAP